MREHISFEDGRKQLLFNLWKDNGNWQLFRLQTTMTWEIIYAYGFISGVIITSIYWGLWYKCGGNR